MDTQSVQRGSLHPLLAGLSLLLYLIIITGADVHGRVNQLHFTVEDALAKVVMDPPANLFGLALLAIPFIASHFLSAIVGRKCRSPLLAITVLAIGSALIAVVYAIGFDAYYEMMAREKWTAASLALGLLPLKATMSLLLPLVVALVLIKRSGVSIQSR
jgi:hypothetical protein